MKNKPSNTPQAMEKASKYSEIEILQSTDGISRAKAPEQLWQRILQKVDGAKKVYHLVPLRKVWLGAAALAGLFLLNMFSVRYFQSEGIKKSGANTLIQEYGIVQDQIDIYK